MSGSVYWFICSREAAPAALPTAASVQARFNRDVTNAIAGVRKSRHGIGDLLPRPIAKAVKDHLLCDGSAVSRTAFPQLFAEIGTQWGSGDGSATFNLPDLNNDALPQPVAAPTQTVSDGGTVSTGETVVQPVTPAQAGGTSGGNISTGGRPRKLFNLNDPDDEP